MSPEQRDFFVAITAEFRILADGLAVALEHCERPAMAQRMRAAADDVRDAWNELGETE